jgi:hypothetical protein
MQYDIRHQAGPQFDALAHRLEELAPEVVPHVQEVTALPLPETITIRLVTVPEWMRLWAQHDEQVLAAEVEALSLTYEEAEQGRSFLRTTREAHRTMGVGGQTVTYDGYASLVVLADSLLEAGHLKGGAWDTPYLRKLIAHELTHVGQHTAGGEVYRLVTHTPFPQLRQHADRNWPFACEGHAVWADELISARFGDDSEGSRPPVHGRVPDGRWSSDTMPAEVLDHIKAVGANGVVGSARFRKNLRWYADSGRAVGEVIAACGVHAINRIWTEPELLPTYAEERDPLAWQRRLMGLPPNTNGPGDFAAGLLPWGGTRSVAITTPGRL